MNLEPNEQGIVQESSTPPVEEPTTENENTTDVVQDEENTTGVVNAEENTTGVVNEEEPSFTPSLKYKVRDEEFDMDDWVKDMVKDEETEKKFQDLYTKGHGLKVIKEERDTFKEELGGLKESLQYVDELLKKGDTEGFIQALNLDPKMFMDYAIQKLKYEQMSPQEKQQYDSQRQEQYRLQSLEQQNQQLMQQATQAQTQQRAVELDHNLRAPEVSQFAQSYDSRMGQGAFRELVVQRGIYHWNVNGTDIPVQQAVNEALQIIGGTQGGTHAAPQTGQVGTPPADQAQVTQAQKSKPVIPNIQGQGTVSPTKKTFKSIDELRNHHRQMTAQG